MASGFYVEIWLEINGREIFFDILYNRELARELTKKILEENPIVNAVSIEKKGVKLCRYGR